MSNNETKLGMAPNVAALLCNTPCCIGFVFSVVAVAMQVAAIVASLVMGVLGTLIWLLSFVVGVAFLGAQIFLMIKANNNEEFRLPVLGDMAANWL